MNKRQLGKSDLNVSEISMGGSVPTTLSYGTPSFDAQIRRMLLTAFEHGINLFDNAEGYGNGVSEVLLGEALKDVRSQVYIASKASYLHTKPETLKAACEESLRRLKTDYIDLFYVHFPNSEVPLSDTIGAMVELKNEGKIRAIGVSNFSISQLREACTYGQIDALQTCYSLLWRKYVEHHLQPYCVENRIGLLPFSPLASGLLSGKYGVSSTFSEGDQRARVGETGLLVYQKEWRGEALDVVEKLRPVAVKYSRSVAQIALHWLAGRAAVSSVISGAKNEAQILENLGSVGWKMGESDLAAIDEASRRFTDKLPDYLHYFMKMVGTNTTL